MMGVAYIALIFSYLFSAVYCSGKSVGDCPNLGNYIDCSGEGFTTIPGNIPKWVNVLNLSKNPIKNIEPLTFQNLSQLKQLDMKRNNISDLGDATFYGLSSIKILTLDFNHIQVIRKKWLFNLSTLEKLSLSHNKINNIDADAWEYCPALQGLNLSFNKLTAINKNTFFNLQNLQKLNLNNNNISYLDDGAFLNTPKLKVLHLSNNKIHFTIEDAHGIFRGLNNLEQFYIASNGIKSIKKNAFAGLNKLLYLDLNHNNVTSVQKFAFTEMPSLKVLIMNTSALLCDCNLQWFYNWLKMEKKLKAGSQLICAYPDGLKNQSLTSVLVENFTCDNIVKPRLIGYPEAEIMALKGENVSLSCRAISSSSNPMTFQWKKDGKDIPNPNVTNRAITSAGKNIESITVLNIYHVQQSDSGKYQCIISNSFGTVYSQKSTISVLIYPQFEKIPRNVTAQNGTNVTIECGAIGEPKPVIAWQKDGGTEFPAAKERRMQVGPEDDAFYILNVKPVDMGVYSCTAHNPAGKIVANATVTVEEIPYFSKKMEDREVTAGESVVMKCMAGGIPKPSIQWLKNQKPIHPTERHFFTAEDQLMIIIDATPNDAGTYQCVLSNSLGVSNASSVLVVKPVVTNDKAETISDKMGIIIVTVVCCAVATSIVWVVIIYQARKRIRCTNNSPPPDPMIIKFTEQTACFAGDNTSEHSSCKDSGTGDSAKRSNDDLLPESEYTLIINNVNSVDTPSTMRAASLVYVPADANNSQTPLLHSNCPTYHRSTNHDRLHDKQPEVVIIEKYPKEVSDDG